MTSFVLVRFFQFCFKDNFSTFAFLLLLIIQCIAKFCDYDTEAHPTMQDLLLCFITREAKIADLHRRFLSNPTVPLACWCNPVQFLRRNAQSAQFISFMCCLLFYLLHLNPFVTSLTVSQLSLSSSAIKHAPFVEGVMWSCRNTRN